MPTESGAYRPVTNADRDAAAKALSGGFEEVFGAAVELFTDRPGFVASTNERSPLAAAVRAVSQFNCRQWGAADKTNYSTTVNIGNAEICGAYLESIGEAPDPGDVGFPFEGGNCAGTVYALTLGGSFSDFLDGEFLNNGSVSNSFIGGVVFDGPISGTSKEPRSFGTTGLPQSWNIRVNFGAGATRLITIDPTDLPPVGGRTERRLNSFSASFSRVGGNPDDCAPPPQQIKPPGSNPRLPLPPNINVNIPGIGPTTVTINPGPDGQPEICLEELNVCINPNLEPPAAPSTPPAPNPGEPGASGDTGSGGEEEGEAPPDMFLVGIQIDILETPPNSRPVAPGVFRSVCYAYLGVPGQLDLDPAGAYLRSGQFIYAETDFLTAYRVSANVGFSLRVTPYYREKE